MSEMPPGTPTRAVRIGITGPIGCGKSTIAGWLGKRPGVLVIDADEVAREVLRPGEPALDAVIARFGAALRLEDGSLDRAALGRVVFADPAALADLEAIVHPAIRPRILASLASADATGARAVVIEAIKLVEGGLGSMCDEVWLVTCERGEQVARLVGRGSSAADAEQRLRAQGDVTTRLRPFATRVIDTSGDREAVLRIAGAALTEAIGRIPRDH